jgi:hypothetical protein
MKTRNLLAGTLTLLAGGILGQGLIAHDGEHVNRMFYMDVKTGHEMAFYEKLAEHAQWRRDEGDPWTWWVYQVVNGENHGDCIVRSGPVAWEALDEYEAFDLKAAPAFWESVGEHLEDTHSKIAMLDDRFVRWHPEMDDVRLFSVITYHLKPGMQKTFVECIKKYHEVIVENDYPAYYAFDLTMNGGSGGEISLVLFHKNWADVEPPEERMMAFMARMMGEEEAMALGETFTSCFSGSESMMARYMPELSILHETEEEAE